MKRSSTAIDRQNLPAKPGMKFTARDAQRLLSTLHTHRAVPLRFLGLPHEFWSFKNALANWARALGYKLQVRQVSRIPLICPKCATHITESDWIPTRRHPAWLLFTAFKKDGGRRVAVRGRFVAGLAEHRLFAWLEPRAVIARNPFVEFSNGTLRQPDGQGRRL
jgi:hypothetical protein